MEFPVNVCISLIKRLTNNRSFPEQLSDLDLNFRTDLREAIHTYLLHAERPMDAKIFTLTLSSISVHEFFIGLLFGKPRYFPHFQEQL